MKLGAWVVLVGYAVLVAVIGWPGLIAAGLHIGSLALFGRWR